MNVPPVLGRGQDHTGGYSGAEELHRQDPLAITIESQGLILESNAYRGADYQPVIPVDAPQDARLDIKPHAETDGADRHGDELDDDEGRTPSLWVDVVRGRP